MKKNIISLIISLSLFLFTSQLNATDQAWNLAQVGNNIIEDANYLKLLVENTHSYDEIFENFSRNTFKKKSELKSISNIVGISFGMNSFTKIRDSLVSNFSDKLMSDFLKKVWYD